MLLICYLLLSELHVLFIVSLLNLSIFGTLLVIILSLIMLVVVISCSMSVVKDDLILLLGISILITWMIRISHSSRLLCLCTRCST